MAMDDHGNPPLLTTLQYAMALAEIGIDMGDIVIGLFVDDRLDAGVFAGLELMGHSPPDTAMFDGIRVLEVNEGFHG